MGAKMVKPVPCTDCGQNMNPDAPGGSADTCLANKTIVFPDGVKLPSIPADFPLPDDRCHDCGIKTGGFHHPSCDVERCPKCGGQLISCGCLDPIEETEETKVIPPPAADWTSTADRLHKCRQCNRVLDPLKPLDRYCSFACAVRFGAAHGVIEDE